MVACQMALYLDVKDNQSSALIYYPLKSMTQKGNAFLGLGQFDAAKESYESLRTLGDNAAADKYLKKLDDAQARDANCMAASFSPSPRLQSTGQVTYKLEMFYMLNNRKSLEFRYDQVEFSENAIFQMERHKLKLILAF